MIDYRWIVAAFILGAFLCWLLMWGHILWLRSEVAFWRKMWKDVDVKFDNLFEVMYAPREGHSEVVCRVRSHRGRLILSCPLSGDELLPTRHHL